MNFTIEKLSVDNYNKSNKVWDMKHFPLTEQFRKEVADGNRDSFLLKLNRKYIAGCDLVYDYGDYTEAGVKIYLSRLIVKKTYRNQGVGQEMLKYIITLCKEKGYQQLTVGVDTDNENAVHIYKKFGFEIYETDADEQGEYYKMILTL